MFIPSIRRGNGTAHLRRSLLEAAGLVRAGHAAVVYADRRDPAGCIDVDAVTDDVAKDLSWADAASLVANEMPSPETVRAAVLDRRETAPDEIRFLRPGTPVVAVDEGGPLRRTAHYTVDTLPVVPGCSPPNVSDRSLIRLPPRGRAFPRRIDRVVVTFGGEDPFGLTVPACEALRAVAAGAGHRLRITAVVGPSFSASELPEDVETLVRPSRLADMLHRFDLVMTSFGLTAYEAAAAGCAVLLINPTAYHEKIAAVDGFVSLGVQRCARRADGGSRGGPGARRLGRSGRRLLQKVLHDPAILAETPGRSPTLSGPSASNNGASGTANGAGPRRSLSILLRSLHFPRHAHCPVCRTWLSPSVARFSDRGFFRCPRCSLVYTVPFTSPSETYGPEYFFEQYRDQYGKTYLDDFGHIKAMGHRRLRLIRRLAGRRIRHGVLDIGCAYGPFLAAAREDGAPAYGIDVSPGAVEYVRTTVGVPAAAGAFPSVSVPDEWPSMFGVVTMWYVIEHFQDLAAVLEAVSQRTLPGGLFAFSTPHLGGVSTRTSLRSFLGRSPSDHFTVWSRRSARRVLRRFGFRVVRIRITGHHPERFPLTAGRTSGPMHRAAGIVSRVFGLGDTFEVYARRRRNP